MIFTKEILLRARIMLLSVMIFMVAIIIKIINVQYFEGSKWRDIAKQSQLEYKPILASRGNIYSDDGALLATSLPFYAVALDPTIVSEEDFQQGIEILSQKLSDFYEDRPAEYYKNRIIEARKKKRKYLLLNAKYITYEEKKNMLQWPIFKKGKFKGGVIFEEQCKRYNPFQKLAKRTLGIYRDNHGSGLEYAFNTELQGVNGEALYQKVVGGNWKHVQENTMVRPIHGYDVETTIDINLQDVTQSSLFTVLERTSAQHGCAIVMEVSTGAVKAIANLTRNKSGKYVESYNYAVGNQGMVEPGSVFKLASMLALLEEVDWPLTEPIDTGNGALKFYNRWMRDVKKGGYGSLTLQEVFEKSSNVGIAMAIQQVFGANPQKFIDYIEQLNMHKPLGIELVGEGKPYMVTPRSKMWNGITLPWLSIGYNIQITPLHVLVLYNAVANNGKMVKPMFVRNIKSINGIIKSFPTIVLKEKICSDTTLHKLKIMLEGAVERGTARRIKHDFYKIAGKTGTAQKIVNGKYTNDHLTSFVGYFPADRPRYSCIIIVDSPQGEDFRFGAEVPAPIFKDIVDRIAGKDIEARECINALKCEPKSVKISTTGHINRLMLLCRALHFPLPEQVEGNEGWANLSVHSDGLCFQSIRTAFSQEVPNVLNMKLRDALFLLENHGLTVTIQGNMHGNVLKQSLLPYKFIPSDRKITIVLK